MEGKKKHHFPLALYALSHHPSLAFLACLARLRLQNSPFFFFKSVKKSVKRGVRVLRERSVRVSHARRLFPVSLSVFSLVPDLLFDCSRVVEFT